MIPLERIVFEKDERFFAYVSTAAMVLFMLIAAERAAGFKEKVQSGPAVERAAH